jgi:hypothetical protein
MSPTSFTFDSGTIYLEDFVISCALQFATEHNLPWTLKEWNQFLGYSSLIEHHKI